MYTFWLLAGVVLDSTFLSGFNVYRVFRLSSVRLLLTNPAPSLRFALLCLRVCLLVPRRTGAGLWSRRSLRDRGPSCPMFVLYSEMLHRPPWSAVMG